jgi:hypothetical protein
MNLPVAASRVEKQPSPKPWVLPERGLTVYYGCPEMPRLAHYFLPRVLLDEQCIYYIDGANQISPHLIARFARERGLEPSVFCELIRVARPFNCFQLTALVEGVPEYLPKFLASVLIVTALPDMHFDEDVRELEARASFRLALAGLETLGSHPIRIAVFSDATSFKTRRMDFFRLLCKKADQVVKVEASPNNELSFTCEKTAALLSQ